MEVIKENSKIVLEKWVNQFSDELFSWALYKTSYKGNCRRFGARNIFGSLNKIDTLQEKSQPKPGYFLF